jgi:hypothetical protein
METRCPHKVYEWRRAVRTNRVNHAIEQGVIIVDLQTQFESGLAAVRGINSNGRIIYCNGNNQPLIVVLFVLVQSYPAYPQLLAA